MRQVRRIAIWAFATVTLGLMTAGTASAVDYPLTGLPEVGRCVPKAGTGGFIGPKCVRHSATHTGAYEWLPGPGASPGFHARLLTPVLETTAGNKISCSFAFFRLGEITSGKTLKINEVELQGCLLIGPNMACYTNPLESGRIVSQINLIGELGLIPGSTTAVPWAGWDLKAESEPSPMIEFSCGETGTPPPLPAFKVSLEGSVIGRVKPTNK